MTDEKNLQDMDRQLSEYAVNASYREYSYNEDEVADSARTTASSTRDHYYENGRRYHAYRQGSYPMPNDDLNVQHEQIANHMWNVLFEDKLVLAPIGQPRNIIDLGTGIGLWADDMANMYPDANVLGVDLTPPPQSLSPNLQLRVDDITQEWTTDEKFDLVHIRTLFGSIEDWPDLYKKILENMEPGGWIQQTEMEIKPHCDDNTLPVTSTFNECAGLAQMFNETTGKIFTLSDHMKDNVEAAGFIDVTERRFKIPLGPWSSDEFYKKLGYWFEAYWRTGFQGWLMGPATRFGGWTQEQVNQKVQEAFKEIDSRTQHVYFEAVVIYARKP